MLLILKTLNEISQNTYKYSLKVWLTSMMLSPFFYIAININNLLGRPEMKGFGILVFWGLCLVFSFIFSLLGFFLFHFIVSKTHKFKWTDLKRKTILAIVGLIITLIPLAFVFGHDGEYKDIGTVKLIIAYCMTTIVGIYFYKLRPQVSEALKTATNMALYRDLSYVPAGFS